MLPTSHKSPMDTEAALMLRGELPLLVQTQVEMVPLAEAFAHFIQSSSRLEEVYRKLQMQICVLTQELAERNAQLQESLERNEAMHATLHQMVNAMPCGVLVVSAEGKVAVINAECCNLLGIQVSIETELDALLTRLSERWVRPLTSAIAEDGEQEFSVEADCGLRWVSVRSCSVRRGDDGMTGCDHILVLRDITGRRRAEEDRERGRNAMALAEMAMMLAHEVRNPLASLELFSDLIEQDEERRGEWIEGLRAGIRLLSGTVNNVLSFQELMCVGQALVDVDEVVDEAVGLLMPVARQAGVELARASRGAEVIVHGNAAGLQQVVVNLLVNGIRHTPTGGRVEVVVSRRLDTERRGGGKDLVVVECLDEGPGIAVEEPEVLFEAGYSGSGASPGLGLTVCRKILKQHGGSVRAENSATGGARFVMEIPAVAGESAA